MSNQLLAEEINYTPAQLVAKAKISVQSASVSEGAEATGPKVTVRFSDGDPEVAETVLRTMFEAMVELSAVTNKQRLKAIATELNERLPAIETELRQAEQKLEAYDRNERARYPSFVRRQPAERDSLAASSSYAQMKSHSLASRPRCAACSRS